MRSTPLVLCMRVAVLLLLMVGGARAQTPSSAESGDVLVSDNETTMSWRAVRFRIPAHIAAIREGVREGGAGVGLTDALADLGDDLDLFDKLAQRLSPEDWPEVQAQSQRVRKLGEMLGAAYATGSRQQLLATTRVMIESIDVLEEMARKSDVKVGRAIPTAEASLPADWGALRFPGKQPMPMELHLLAAQEILDEIRARAREMERNSRIRLRREDDQAAREVGELARALVSRQGEVPVVSRPGFRNAALRMEVVSDNLVTYLSGNDRLAFRRQLKALMEAAQESASFVAMRTEGIRK